VDLLEVAAQGLDYGLNATVAITSAVEGDVVLRVERTGKRDPDWWVMGGGTPMNLYSIRQNPDPDAAYIRQ
jgi:hypothetical protein